MFFILDNKISVLDTKDGVIEVTDKETINTLKQGGISFRVGLPELTVSSVGLNVLEMERTSAIMLIDGKTFVGSTHQDCLYDYMKQYKNRDIYEEKGLNVSTDDLVEPFTDTTFNMFENCEAYGFDVYNDEFLVAHSKETSQKTISWMKSYALLNNDLKLYVFMNYGNNIYKIKEVL